MDFQKIKEFTVLAESDSLKAASGKLGMSPALLSVHIRNLEKELNVDLFDRTGGGLLLNEWGKRFLADAKGITADYDQLLRSLHTTDREDLSLNIGVSGFVMAGNIALYLEEVNRNHPDIRMNIFDDLTHSLEDVKNGRLDVFFSYSPDDAELPGLSKVVMFKTKVLVLVPGNHRLANQTRVLPEDLDGETFLLYPETLMPFERDCEIELLSRAGISYTEYPGDVSPESRSIMVPIGKGIMLCPWVIRHLMPPNTAAISVDSPFFEYRMCAFYNPESKNPFAAEFISGLIGFASGRSL